MHSDTVVVTLIRTFVRAIVSAVIKAENNFWNQPDQPETRSEIFRISKSGRVIIVRSEIQEFPECGTREKQKIETWQKIEFVGQIGLAGSFPSSTSLKLKCKTTAIFFFFFWKWTTEWTTPSIDLYLPSGIEIALTDVTGRKPETSREKSVPTGGWIERTGVHKICKTARYNRILYITKQSSRIE